MTIFDAIKKNHCGKRMKKGEKNQKILLVFKSTLFVWKIGKIWKLLLFAKKAKLSPAFFWYATVKSGMRAYICSRDILRDELHVKQNIAVLIETSVKGSQNTGQNKKNGNPVYLEGCKIRPFFLRPGQTFCKSKLFLKTQIKGKK